eukprot:g2401.t1
MTSVLTRAKALADALRGCYAEAGEGGLQKCRTIISALAEELGGAEVSPAAKNEVTQVGFRALNLELLKEARAASQGAGERNYAPVGRLLDIAIGCVSETPAADAWAIGSHVPFLLLGDLLQCEPTSCCAVLWGLLEARREVLTRPVFIPQVGKTVVSKSALALLKLCNELLRKLSKATHAEFRGRVLHFLAFVFPIHERSAVNVSGKANTGNTTDFAAEEEFNAEAAALAAEEAAEAAGADDSGAVAGPESSAASTSSSSGSPAAVVDFKLYRALWALQKPLANPRATVSAAAPWASACSAAAHVLGAFEGSAFSEADLASADEADTAGTDASAAASALAPASSEQTHFFEPKYLTASRLLRLQLRDPLFRKNVLTQFLILFRAATALAGPAADAGAGAADAPAVARHIQAEPLRALQERCVALLRRTPPDGPSFEALLRHVLARDEQWIAWKQDKCPAFGREDPDAQLQKIFGDTAPGIGGGQQQDASSGAPALVDFVEPFEDAMDPANAIEEEYHPKQDKVYMWRLGRLLTRHHIQCMQVILEEGPEEGVRAMQGAREAGASGGEKSDE